MLQSIFSSLLLQIDTTSAEYQFGYQVGSWLPFIVLLFITLIVVIIIMRKRRKQGR
jgi:dolichyl-phosphate-mannose--protein O-mannosyl transferase